MNELNQSKINELNERMTNLVIALQEQVKELKEDTLLNAQHIKVLKDKHQKETEKINDTLKDHIDNTSQLVEQASEMSEQNETNNYTDFLKTLLESDFKAEQTKIIENTKRELLGAKSSKKNNDIFATIAPITNLLGLVAFVLVFIICYKYKLLIFALSQQ